MTSEHAAGWYPDPTGRYEQRWWDGTAWTATISTSGTVGDDPAGPPTAPDRSMLDAASLAIDFTATGVERSGVWRVHDRTAGREVGRMTIDHGGAFGPAAYAAFDAEGRRLFSLERPSRLGLLTLLVRDHLGRPVGRIAKEAGDSWVASAGAVVSLRAPATSDPHAAEVTWATSRMWWREPLTTPLQLFRADGMPFGVVHVDHGSWQRPARAAPSWFHLDRAPDVPEPLRTLAVAFVPFVGVYLRDATRNRGTAGVT